MKVTIHASSWKQLIECLKQKDTLTRETIQNILHQEDYQFEFDRYQNRVTLDEFTEYLLTFENLKEEDIENEDLRIHHSLWLHFYQNLNLYEKEIQTFFNQFNPNVINQAALIAAAGFPEGYALEEVHMIFTCGIGQSFGYPYDNGMHFDLLRLVSDSSMRNNFINVIAHEIHHLIFNHTIKEEINDVEGYFVQCFAGEGLAIKFTNNAEGVLSKCFDTSRNKNCGLDADSIAYLNNDFEDTWHHFKHTLNEIRSGKIKSIDEVNTILFSYWLNTYKKEQSHDENPALQQSRLYTFGNDLWGTIYDVFGMDVLYETLQHPSQCISCFNQALLHLNQTKYIIN